MNPSGSGGQQPGRRHQVGSLISGLLVAGAGTIGLLAAPEHAGASVADTGSVTLEPRDPIGWTDAGCNGCHEVDAVFSHPVGMAPARPLPPEFPLDRGRMTCVTCHDASDPARHAEARTGPGDLLRTGDAGFALCVQCHETSMSSATSAHAMAMGRAHLRWPGDWSGHEPGSFGAGLDAESASCLECHDGSLATDVGSGTPGGFVALMSGGDHPVGVPYRADNRSRSSGRMAHPDSVDRRVRLYDGTVGCGSCHSVYSEEPGHLVMSNLGSALCLSCHEDD